MDLCYKLCGLRKSRACDLLNNSLNSVLGLLNSVLGSVLGLLNNVLKSAKCLVFESDDDE